MESARQQPQAGRRFRVFFWNDMHIRNPELLAQPLFVPHLAFPRAA